ncbi:glycosyltransferase [Bhargavaea beijingensis]|uniref:Glycosyltransferase family 1 protein n=1 Tax=Bhargavaea beijingensis TaxID=426756 RepID=A0ABX9ZEE1_9BACL|nr:glycosyltransferase [Bhargavaea beijingensis]RSK33696.1 glycosyltransferase family 1 protein [Bhargavaea beijingensis]
MKRKVLQIGYRSLANGGIQAVIMGIVRNLRNDIQFDILLFSNKAGYYDMEFSEYGKIHRIPCDKTGNKFVDMYENVTRPIRSFIGTYRILKNGGYTAVHCHNGIESGITLLAARMAKVPIRITHSHTIAIPREMNLLTKIYKRLVKSLIRTNSTIRVGCSKPAIEYLFGKQDKEAFVIPNGIDLEKFNPEKYIYKKSKNIRFIHVGRFDYEKNHLFLLEVFKEINNHMPLTELILVGFGAGEKEIREKISILHLEDKVKILPHDSDIPKLFASSDYMVFPSKAEGLGLVLLEAQLMGVRCFASDNVPKESDLGLCSYFSLKERPEEWGQKIIAAIDHNESKKDSISKEKLLRVDIKTVSSKYKGIYQNTPS